MSCAGDLLLREVFAEGWRSCGIFGEDSPRRREQFDALRLRSDDRLGGGAESGASMAPLGTRQTPSREGVIQNALARLLYRSYSIAKEVREGVLA